jgi:glutamate carboxypeptidase
MKNIWNYKMKYIKNLKKIVEINSYTKNKQGVDAVSALMTKWLEKIDFKTKIYNKEVLGNHILYKSKRAKYRS